MTIMRLMLIHIALFFCSAVYLSAQEREVPTKKLLPNLVPLPNLEFAVPSDFTVGFQTEKPDPRANIYWGSRESITSFFQENSPGRGPIFQIKLSANVTQKGPNSFNGEETIFRDMVESGYKNVRTTKHAWGSYPLLVFEGDGPNGDAQYTIWMGLNSPDGSTLRFFLMPEAGQKKQNPQHVEVWKTFLTHTVETPSGEKQADPSKAVKEVKEPSPWISYAEGRLKVLAERRSTDNRLLVVIEPANEKIFFELQELREHSQPPAWSVGKPVVKIYGEVSLVKEGMPQIQAQIIPAVIKKVDRFSVDYEKLQQNGRNTVILR